MEKTEHKHGQFSWVDMMAKDVDQAKRFYSALFDWDAEDQHDPDGSRIYTMFRLGDKDIAGLGGMTDDMKASGMPPVWNSYVNVESVDDVAQKVEAAGGKVTMPAMDIMDSGRMAVFADPTGAMFSVWQAGKHIGAQRVTEPGAFCWNELMTRDIDAAKAFYGAVFGWTTKATQGAMPYEMVMNGDDMNGGMIKMEGEQFKDVPPNWTVYFQVADVDAACAKVKSLGGAVHVDPQEIPQGRLAVLHDDQGAWFSLMQMKG